MPRKRPKALRDRIQGGLGTSTVWGEQKLWLRHFQNGKKLGPTKYFPLPSNSISSKLKKIDSLFLDDSSLSILPANKTETSRTLDSNASRQSSDKMIDVPSNKQRKSREEILDSIDALLKQSSP